MLKGEKAYDEFFAEYNEMKLESSDTVSKEAIISAEDENIENIPIISGIQKANKIVVIETEKEAANDPGRTIIIAHENIKKRYKADVPKPD